MEHLLNTSKRIEWVDYLKGLSIFLVVLGHSYVPFTNVESVSWAFRSIYAFHMPLFFVLSGVTAAVSMLSKGDVKQFLYLRMVSIFIPYLCWSFLRPLFFASRSEWESYSLKDQFLSFAGGDVAIWFLPALLTLLIYYCAFYCLSKRVNSLLGQVAGLIGIFILAFGLHRLWGKTSPTNEFTLQWLTSAYSYFIPFFFGVFLVHFKKFFQLATENRYSIALSLLFLCTISFNIGTLPYSQYLKMLCGICAAIVFIRLFMQWTGESIVKRQLRLLGQYSLIIYIASGLFEAAGLNLLLEGMNATFVQIAYGVASLIVCYTCILFAKFIELSDILSFFLLGKRPKIANKPSGEVLAIRFPQK